MMSLARTTSDSTTMPPSGWRRTYLHCGTQQQVSHHIACRPDQEQLRPKAGKQTSHEANGTEAHLRSTS